MLDKKLVTKLLKIYKTAWEKRDPNLILTIFTPDGEYHEKAFDKPYKNHKGIKEYWQNKVVGEQTNIKLKLNKIFIDGNTAIAEWYATFKDHARKLNIQIKEIAVMEFKGNKIKKYREYWHSKKTDF